MRHQNNTYPKHTLPCLAALLTSVFGLDLHSAGTLQFEYSQYSATENTPSVLVAVQRTGDTTGAATVQVDSLDVSGAAGEDYEAVSLTLQFSEGDVLRTFRVPLLNDSAEESNETFRLTLTNPLEATLGARRTANVIVTDNDPGVQFPWRHFWCYERDGQLTVTVHRGNDEDLSPFTVDYATSNGTALAGLDYTARSGTLAFAEGEMTKTLTVPIADDEEVEAREEFGITLSDSTGPGGLGANSTATLLVYDTTGYEPRGFGSVHLVSPENSTARLEVPLLGCSGGHNAQCFEILGIESSEDLATWAPEAWFGIASPALPIAFQPEVNSSSILFFRQNNAALMAAWPPPDSPDGIFATGNTAVGYTERWITTPHAAIATESRTTAHFGFRSGIQLR